MARQLLILWAGRHQREPWERLCAGYRSRIERFLEVRDHWIKVRAGAGRARRRAEGQAMLAALPEPCWTVALDRRGRARGSSQLARWLDRRLTDWPHPLAFVLGSDLGLAAEVGEAARETLSLGPLTLPHELARLVLYEQLYRALSITSGIKYHREPL